jgi:hypothetical protein
MPGSRAEHFGTVAFDAVWGVIPGPIPSPSAIWTSGQFFKKEAFQNLYHAIFAANESQRSDIGIDAVTHSLTVGIVGPFEADNAFTGYNSQFATFTISETGNVSYGPFIPYKYYEDVVEVLNATIEAAKHNE